MHVKSFSNFKMHIFSKGLVHLKDVLCMNVKSTEQKVGTTLYQKSILTWPIWYDSVYLILNHYIDTDSISKHN